MLENGVPPSPEGPPLPEKKLVSWKEIAAHLGREVRTVQRWATTEGLPVHRHEHTKKSTVYAYPIELHEWVRNRRPVHDPEADSAFARDQELGELDPSHLGVIAATSSRIVAKQDIPDIGRTLNVKYVLEGSVHRAGNQVRIDVQLIQVSDETHLWADSFTRELSDVLQVESDVSAAIARQILATLPLPPQPEPLLRPGTVHAATPEIAASRHAYHQGKFAWGSRFDLRSSIAFFQEAIRLDPSYAEAYAGLAGATAILGQAPNDVMQPGEAKPKAREAAQKALQLTPTLAEAHAVLCNLAMSDSDFATAEKELLLAI